MQCRLITTYLMLGRTASAKPVLSRPKPFLSNDDSGEFSDYNEAFMAGVEHETAEEQAQWHDKLKPADTEQAAILALFKAARSLLLFIMLRKGKMMTYTYRYSSCC
jgi:hypothetical protein